LTGGAKKPGFWGGYHELSVGCGKETRFLGFWGWLLGQRNRVSGVNIRSYLWVARKKPGFWGSGVGCWGKETGFLGFWGWLVEERNRVSEVGIRSYLWEAGKKPGF